MYLERNCTTDQPIAGMQAGGVPRVLRAEVTYSIGVNDQIQSVRVSGIIDDYIRRRISCGFG
jgi:hypothetical protein